MRKILILSFLPCAYAQTPPSINPTQEIIPSVKVEREVKYVHFLLDNNAATYAQKNLNGKRGSITTVPSDFKQLGTPICDVYSCPLIPGEVITALALNTLNEMKGSASGIKIGYGGMGKGGFKLADGPGRIINQEYQYDVFTKKDIDFPSDLNLVATDFKSLYEQPFPWRTPAAYTQAKKSYYAALSQVSLYLRGFPVVKRIKQVGSNQYIGTPFEINKRYDFETSKSPIEEGSSGKCPTAAIITFNYKDYSGFFTEGIDRDHATDASVIIPNQDTHWVRNDNPFNLIEWLSPGDSKYSEMAQASISYVRLLERMITQDITRNSKSRMKDIAYYPAIGASGNRPIIHSVVLHDGSPLISPQFHRHLHFAPQDTGGSVIIASNPPRKSDDLIGQTSENLNDVPRLLADRVFKADDIIMRPRVNPQIILDHYIPTIQSRIIRAEYDIDSRTGNFTVFAMDKSKKEWKSRPIWSSVVFTNRAIENKQITNASNIYEGETGDVYIPKAPTFPYDWQIHMLNNPKKNQDKRALVYPNTFGQTGWNERSANAAQNPIMNNLKTLLGSAFDEKKARLYYYWLRGDYTREMDTTHKMIKKHISYAGVPVSGGMRQFALSLEYLNTQKMSTKNQNILRTYMFGASYGYSYPKYKTIDPTFFDFLIVNSNDGFVHFHQYARDNAGTQPEFHAGFHGETIPHIMPSFLVERLDNMSSATGTFEFSMDGPVGIFEYITKDDQVRAIGISAMGRGGKGIVGYEISPGAKFYKSGIRGTPAHPYHISTPYPYFEIANEGSQTVKDNLGVGFENLGYTYSDFEFANIARRDGTGQGVAIFGNGPGSNSGVSSLYIIDLDDGKLLNEIILNTKGGGAMTPTVVVDADSATGFQKIDKIYVGDMSGKLYRVKLGNITDKADIDVMYSPVGTNNPISVKPLYFNNDSEEWVFFGTGRRIDVEYDSGVKSLVDQYMIGLKDTDTTKTINNLARRDLVSSNNISKGIDIKEDEMSKDKLSDGWYIPVKFKNERKTGERVIYAPVMNNKNVVFTTWRLNDEGTYFTNNNACMSDFSPTMSSKLIALDLVTGLRGTLEYKGKKVAGVDLNQDGFGTPVGASLHRDSSDAGYVYEKTVSFVKNDVDMKALREGAGKSGTEHYSNSTGVVENCNLVIQGESGEILMKDFDLTECPVMPLQLNPGRISYQKIF